MPPIQSPADPSRQNFPRTGALLRLAWQRVREDIYHRVVEDGYNDLNPSHVALFRYEGLDGRRPSELAESMQITKQSINDLLRRLEQTGYLELRPDPDDKRARLVRLTARGKKLDDAIRRHAQSAESVLVSELGEDAFRQLHKSLLQICNLTGKKES